MAVENTFNAYSEEVESRRQTQYKYRVRYAIFGKDRFEMVHGVEESMPNSFLSFVWEYVIYLDKDGGEGRKHRLEMQYDKGTHIRRMSMYLSDWPRGLIIGLLPSRHDQTIYTMHQRERVYSTQNIESLLITVITHHLKMTRYLIINNGW